MKFVTINQLADVLFAKSFQKGAAVIASVIQYTDAKAKKTNNPFGVIMKLTTLTVLLNTDYEKGVLNQLKREDKDESEYEKGVNTMPLTFGTNNRFIGLYDRNKDGIMHPVLQYRPFDNSHPKSEYFANNLPIEKEKIAYLLPSKSKAVNQGCEKEIFWRKLYLSNLVELKLDGEHYKIVK